LLELKFGFIGAMAAKLCGKKYGVASQNETIEVCRKGALDAAVVSVDSGKNGCNLQGMNIMVSFGDISQASEEEQAKGNILYNDRFNLTSEGDALEWVRRKGRSFMYCGWRGRPMIRRHTTPTSLKEAEVLTQMAPERSNERVREEDEYIWIE
jgi:hypothetical protein